MNRSTIVAYSRLLQSNVAFSDALGFCKRLNDDQLQDALKALFCKYEWLGVDPNSDVNWNLLAKAIKCLAESL